jgi:uncharacterized HAD superfamily protein
MFKERYPNVFDSFTENLKVLDGAAVGIDIDAVTQATYFLALNNVSHALGKVIHREDLRTYWELANIAKRNGMDPDRAMAFAKDAWNNDYVYQNAPVMPGITTFLQLLNEASVPHKFISSRPVDFKKTTRKFFKNEFPWEKPGDIILGRREGMDGGLFKACMINKYNIALHIEDAIEEAEVIVRETNAHVLIVPQPWNDEERFEHPRIKYLGSSAESNGTWPVLRFLAGSEAKDFLTSVAQSH